MKISGFAGFCGAPGKVVCTFLRFKADCGLSSTAMGLLGGGALGGAAVEVGGLGVGMSVDVTWDDATGRAACFLSALGGGGVLLMVGDGEGGGRFLMGVAGIS